MLTQSTHNINSSCIIANYDIVRNKTFIVSKNVFLLITTIQIYLLNICHEKKIVTSLFSTNLMIIFTLIMLLQQCSHIWLVAICVNDNRRILTNTIVVFV